MVHQIATAQQLNASRLPALFADVSRNRQWWTTGPIPSTYQRVEFAGSQLVWEYYPGQGIQLQVLGTFGKANGLYTGRDAAYGQMEQLLSQMIPMAARRGGGRRGSTTSTSTAARRRGRARCRRPPRFRP